ncbi:MAG: hypothetical protein II956_10975 [Bacteroidales bacterium]|nr:hypothetical protein [Bacteroidales bacterium]
MFIDNTVSMSKWMFAEILTLVLGIAFVVYSSFNPGQFALIAGIVCFVAFVFLLYICPSYFYFNDEIAGKDMIEIRSTQAFPFFRKYRQHGILKKTVKSYSITKSFFGLQKFLSITIKGVDPSTKKTVEKTIEKLNVSILKQQKIQELEKTLQKYIRH